MLANLPVIVALKKFLIYSQRYGFIPDNNHRGAVLSEEYPFYNIKCIFIKYLRLLEYKRVLIFINNNVIFNKSDLQSLGVMKKR